MDEEEMLRLVIDELRAANEGAKSAGDNLDQKANFVFAGGSLIFGLVAAIAVAKGATVSEVCAYRWALVLSVLVYVFLTGIFVLIVVPRNYRTALKEDLGTIDSEVLGRDPLVALRSLVEGYVDTIAHNRGLNKEKSRWIKTSVGVLGSQLVMVILLGFLAR